ncbi:E3 ubiquitin-protein ligase ATL31-like [Syzygium oleosum]|uniref:E3 ubiquitin-protein ligase ATL31-like n=1 Tax=Syzygium oleosum TaxID=219896 RepID=UPI0024B8B7B8|nr:E3 ubiquitin-protein ligase ATL31-like [Syzygium oleosum]
MSPAFGVLCALAALGSASLELGHVGAQRGSWPGRNSTRAGNDNGQYGLYSNLDPTMAIVVVVTVCAFFMMGFFSIYIRHCSEESADAGSRRAVRFVPAGGGGNERCLLRRGLDPGVVDSFPVLAYVAVRDHKLGKGALECAVCLTEFDGFDRLKILPKCEHVFHPECIDAWLASHVTCPVCRANQTPDPCLRLVAAAAAAAEWAADRARISQRRAEEEEEEEHQPRRQQQQPPPCDEVRNEVRIDIGGGGDEELGAAAAAAAESSRAPAGKLPKSHSTGHLQARPGPDPDSYALRLPEEVRNQIRTAVAAAGMRRSTSYDVVLAAIEGSSRKGGRLLAGTPSFLPKADKIHHHTGDGMDGGDREFEVGERSPSRLPG